MNSPGQPWGDVLLVGPYGGANLGDDAIALSFLRSFRECRWSVGITLLGPQPELARAADHVEAYPRLRSLRPGALRAVRGYRSVVIGGGQQLQEPRIPNPLWGHLATAWHFAVMAGHHRRPLALVGVGCDERFSPLGRRLLRALVRRSAYASVRDPESMRVLERHGLCGVRLGADPVFSLGMDFFQSAGERAFDPRRRVLWILSNDKFHDLAYLKVVRAAVLRLEASGFRSAFTLTDLQESYDGLLRTRPELQFEGPDRWLENPDRSLRTLIEAIQNSGCVVTSRMHAVILSSVLNVPVVSISRAAKMDALARRLDLPPERSTSISGLSAEWLWGAVRASMATQGRVHREGWYQLREAALLDLDRVREVLSPWITPTLAGSP